MKKLNNLKVGTRIICDDETMEVVKNDGAYVSFNYYEGGVFIEGFEISLASAFLEINDSIYRNEWQLLEA